MILFEVFSSSIVEVFTLSYETKKLCIYALRIIPLGFIFVGSNIAFQGIFQALGHGVMSLILSISRLVVIVLPLAYALSRFDIAHKIVWISFPVAEIISFIIALIMMNKVKKQNIDTIG
jgi:Na+-driven multidrug efflux pump